MNLSITFTFRESDCDLRRTSDKNFNPQRFPENLDSPGFLQCQKILAQLSKLSQTKYFTSYYRKERNNHADAKRAVESRKGAIYSDDFDHPYGCELRLSQSTTTTTCACFEIAANVFCRFFCHFLSQPKDRLRYAMSSKCHDLRL